MAKHPKRRGRRFRRYIKGNVDENLLLTTLAGRTLVSQVFDEVVIERTLVSSIVANYSMGDFTLGADIGPIMVGLAHSDYSAAEVEEVIENTASWSEADLVAQEIAKRKVRIIGVFENPTGLGDYTINDGKPVKTKLNWILTTGQTIDLWCYNLGASPIATTVPDVHCQGHANLWPQ